MLNILSFFTLFLVVLQFSSGNAGIYTPDTYPDSQRDFDRCGLDHAGYACDPDGFLNPGPDGTKGIEQLDQALQYIRANTECICDKDRPAVTDQQSPSQHSPPATLVPFGRGIWMEQCEKEPNRHGFTVSVVVLGKMEVTDDQRRRYRDGAHLPAIFAAELKNIQKRGQCNDDVLIVLAINDSSIRTSTGGVAATRLSSPLILNASHIAQKFFARRDYTSGLLHMVDQFALKMGAAPRPKYEPGWFDIHFWPFFPEAWRQSNWRWPILIGILLLILLLIVAIIFTVRRLRKNQNSAEYVPGRQTGRTKA